ncbi:MAG: hypothetical protein CL938_11455 [Deltaproteobacteria bacterium]|nr:hypothetical protein [Deltaproteobacteria bacterium]
MCRGGRLITGINTNVRYGGRVFHVQTEDSGRDRPHVISHLYYTGTILASQKTEYAGRLGESDLDAMLRKLMDEQHLGMLERLQQGGFDAVIDDRLGGEVAPSPAAPGEDAEGRAFGDGIVSARPLDTVILEYLVDKSRTRGADVVSQPARTPRSRE